jgi:hypothetical protein
MTTKTEYAFFFAAGLLIGIVVEAYILGPMTQANQASTSGNIVALRDESNDLPESNSQKSNRSEAAGIPRIVVKEPKFSFGDRHSGDVVEHTFELFNDGDETLLIGNILTSCGCTTADIASKSIPPGESVKIEAKLDLHMQRGEQLRTLVVQSNDPSSPNLPLYMVGNAISLVEVTPPFIEIFNPKDGEPHTATVNIKADDSIESLNIEDTETSGENVEAKVETIAEGKEYSVKVKVTKDAAELQGWVRLITDQPGEYKNIVFPISAKQH